MPRAVLVIGKAPLPGRTKTRLTPPLSAEDAASLYQAFLLDALALALSLNWEQTSLIHPSGHAPALRRLVPPGIRLVEQSGTGLGDALSSAFEAHFADGFERAVLIGSDNPTLPRDPILGADAALQAGCDVVVGPSRDGGYYLIGMRRSQPGVFQDIEWSTPRVCAQTLERGRQLGLRVETVSEWYDVDEPPDLDQLRQELEHLPHHIAAHTRAALEAIRAAPAR